MVCSISIHSEHYTYILVEEYESEERDSPADGPQVNSSTHGVNHPVSFIEIIHHPQSGQKTSSIISLDSETPVQTDTKSVPNNSLQVSDNAKPWAPFRTRADFEFTRTMITKALDRETIETLLKGFNGRWSTQTDISIRDYQDYQHTLSASRYFGIPVSFLKKKIV